MGEVPQHTIKKSGVEPDLILEDHRITSTVYAGSAFVCYLGHDTEEVVSYERGTLVQLALSFVAYVPRC